MTNLKSAESRLRKLAARRGLRLHKPRWQGNEKYWLVDDRNICVDGTFKSDFDGLRELEMRLLENYPLLSQSGA